MRRHYLIAWCLVASLCTPPHVRAEGIKIDSREYKLILDSAKFAGANPTNIVNEFWHQVLTPIIEQRLDSRANGKPRHKANFELDKERHVAFRDAKNCILTVNGYALRERTKLKGGVPDASTREITLKFRTPDLFLAAMAPFGGASDNAKSKLEEDVTPEVERRAGPLGSIVVAFAEPPGMRSLFSASVSQRIEADASVTSLRDVMELHPGLEKTLHRADGDPVSAVLVSGASFHELVFSGALVDLGAETNAEFDLTLWYRPGAAFALRPVIAELSFKYDTDQGRVAEPVARRAFSLFRAMQEQLGDWTSPEHQTKTSMALPPSCSAH
jgi:hypothetical protein